MRSNMCAKKMVVYLLTCLTCSKRYIGSTIRTLHKRIEEHCNNQDGIIKSHGRYCLYPNFIPTIIDSIHGDGELELRLKEAIHIKNLKPELNTKEELDKLMDLII